VQGVSSCWTSRRTPWNGFSSSRRPYSSSRPSLYQRSERRWLWAYSLARVWQAAGHVANSAATIALVAPTSDDAHTHDLVQFDLGQATMSVMLAAADLGIGSAHAGVGDQELARRLLGVPEDRFCSLLIALGRPAARPLTPIQRPNRRPFDDVVHRGHW
jgi:nitroreductase